MADPSPAGPLEGVTVLDLSTVGPAARCTRLLGDYGARVVKVGPVPSADAAPIQPQFFAYSGHRGMRRVLVDLKDDGGREAFLALAAAADVVVESFRPGVVDRLGIGYAAVSARQCGGGVLLDERLRAGRPGGAVGGARHRLPRRRRLPGPEHAGRRWGAAAAGRHRGRRRGGRHAGRAGHHGRAGRACVVGAGRVSRRVGGRGRPVAHVAPRRRAAGARWRHRARPRHPLGPLRLLRHLPDE